MNWTYIIREWIDLGEEQRDMVTVTLHAPLTVRIALESVFKVGMNEQMYNHLFMLNIGSTMTMHGKRGEQITDITVTRVS